jgi:hypothetical protein
MRYLVMTYVPPEEVIERAKTFFAENTRLGVAEERSDAIRFTGELGTASFRVDREHGHTNVHAETDRGVGLDVTDLTKRFLYSLGHI